VTRPIWLIEANVDGLATEPIQSEIRRQGMATYVVKHLPALATPKDIAGSETLPMDACVIFRGTLPLMRHIQGARRWRPGGWCTFQNLACSTYYAYFGDYLLNRDYAMLPVGDAVRLANSLFARYGVNEMLFVRPDSVDKSFNGTVVDRHSFLPTLAGAIFDPSTMIVIAKPKNITHEWRLIIGNGRVLAGSQYAVGGIMQLMPGVPEEVTAFVSDILDRVAFRPDPLFVIDVCNSEDGLKILELNSFSCSAHHGADLATIIRTASAVAANAY
jgi:hypothetical protein